ncbi:hypothetical protein [Thauera linaloolentis]|uniref:Uncharacterized protein n=1 Tax=Thauera linaloolentis (strain DSM 12138 / JCM 21573 / CCUG 41526 / CIP 105981 / IAM 15112 / NBRC 102519 / 47Lol) TaxID=1123367 RepID=N6Y856_THAL4|nr:hypothetical protein [Thauera linaloolentis]ENO90436.1 hypothetical protein C666_00990 [Thauera linaloolentis 47Lol = DSM 12138]MCM8566296.1 hypothetical protein [Thauera linaloolentis]
MAERHIEIVYCDDIRTELGNKHSLMGVYLGDMFIDVMPVVLPKLCAWVNVVTPLERPFSRLRVRVFHNDAAIIDSGELTKDGGQLEFGDGLDDSIKGEDGQHFMAVNFVFALSPFAIDSESSLVVVAETEDGDMKSRRLRIKKGGVAPTVAGKLSS